VLEKYPVLMRTAIAILLAIGAIFIPVVAIRIILAGVAGILFALILKKYSALLITVIVISMLIVSIGNVANTFFREITYPFRFMGPGWFFNLGNNYHSGNGYTSYNGTEYNDSEYSKYRSLSVLKPDTNVSLNKNTIIKGIAIELIFTDTATSAYIPSTISYSYDGDLTIIEADNASAKNKLVQILVSSDYDFEKLEIQSKFLIISGDSQGEILKLKSNYSEMECDLDYSELIELDGDFLNVAKKLKSRNIEIDSEVINVYSDIESAEDISFMGNFLTGRIKYTDRWQDNRNVSIRANFGELEVLVPSGDNGDVRFKKSGDFISIRKNNY